MWIVVSAVNGIFTQITSHRFPWMNTAIFLWSFLLLKPPKRTTVECLFLRFDVSTYCLITIVGLVAVKRNSLSSVAIAAPVIHIHSLLNSAANLIT